MSIFESILLGLAQGLTEFLPVSSSGHLVLLQNLFGNETNLFFDTMLHLGTLIAVIIVFWGDIVSLIRNPFQKLMGMLIISTIPAIIITLLFNDFIEYAFATGNYLGYGFLWTAAMLIIAEIVTAKINGKKSISIPESGLIGIMQAIAILPGISRSGSTIVGGLLCGIDRNLAAKFAFLMSIPSILASVVYQSAQVAQAGTIGVDIAPVIVGTLVAMVSGLFAIKFMLRLIKNSKLYGFSVYLIILGIFVLIDQNATHLLFH